MAESTHHRARAPGVSVLLATIAACSIAACSTMSVHCDWDTDYRFPVSGSFAWMPPLPSSTLSEANLTHARAAIQHDLAAKGFRFDPVDPDLSISLHASRESHENVVTVGSGSGWNRTSSAIRTPPSTAAYRYDEGSLVLDIVDARQKLVIWRGTATDVFAPSTSPGRVTDLIVDAVNQLLAKFPPPPSPSP